jgi:SsrA-binding protein
MAKKTNQPASPPKSSAAKSGKGGTSAKPKAPEQPRVATKIISENRKAKHEYEIVEALDCGIMLQGSEVKSLRNGKVSLDEAYARMQGNEVLLIAADIAEYPQATLWNHAPKRPRKLLMHREQVRKFAARAHEKGLTLVPLRIFLSERGLIKVTIGLCRGKKLHDKRETMKKQDAKREMDRALRRRR